MRRVKDLFFWGLESTITTVSMVASNSLGPLIRMVRRNLQPLR